MRILSPCHEFNVKFPAAYNQYIESLCNTVHVHVNFASLPWLYIRSCVCVFSIKKHSIAIETAAPTPSGVLFRAIPLDGVMSFYTMFSGSTRANEHPARRQAQLNSKRFTHTRQSAGLWYFGKQCHEMAFSYREAGRGSISRALHFTLPHTLTIPWKTLAIWALLCSQVLHDFPMFWWYCMVAPFLWDSEFDANAGFGRNGREYFYASLSGR